jgi:hypothetical protein
MVNHFYANHFLKTPLKHHGQPFLCQPFLENPVETSWSTIFMPTMMLTPHHGQPFLEKPVIETTNMVVKHHGQSFVQSDSSSSNIQGEPFVPSRPSSNLTYGYRTLWSTICSIGSSTKPA